MSTTDLARYLLNGLGSLGKLMNADVRSLSSCKGMETASFTQFAMIREIGRQILNEELRENITFSNPQTVADYLRLSLGHERVEVSCTLLPNRQNQLIAVRELSHSTVAENTVYIREVVELVLDEYANNLIIAHNHPGGSARPSGAGIGFMKRLAQASDLVDVSLLDRFIVTAKETCSLRETGYMD